MILSKTDLIDKTLPGVNQVLSLSFEYLLLNVSKEYARIAKINTIAEFNEKNNLNLTKTLMYPFFISLSNGHSESLYNLFGKFYSLSFGPVSLELFDIFNEDSSVNTALKYFKINSSVNPLGIELIIAHSEFSKESNLEDCLDFFIAQIKMTEIAVMGESMDYENVNILSDNNQERPLYAAIESGIKAIKKQSETFFISEPDILKLHASYFEAFKDRHNDNEVSVIEYKDIEEGKQRPFYVNEMSL